MDRELLVLAVALAALLGGCDPAEPRGSHGSPSPPPAGTDRTTPTDPGPYLSQVEPDPEAHDSPSQDAEALAAHLVALGYAEYGERLAEGPSGVVHHDRSRSHPGFNLYSVVPLALSVLLDPDGQPVNAWAVPDGHWTMRCELLPDGDVILVGTHGSHVPRAGHIMRMSWEGQLIWRRDLPAHHDVELTPRGELLTIISAPHAAPGGELQWKDNLLLRLDLDGNELERLSLLDLILGTPGFVFTAPDSTDVEDGLLDPLHANSVEWLRFPALVGSHAIFSPSLVLVSLRHQSQVVALDWDSRKLSWWWGRGQVQRQHEATLTSDGRVLMFDNGSAARPWSRVAEVDPRTDAVTWTYTADPPESMYSSGRGTVQALPGGNVLVSHSAEGEAFELTRQGRQVWRFLSPHVNPNGHRAALRLQRLESGFVLPIVARRGVRR